MIVLGSALIFLLAYRWYGRFLSKKVFELDDEKTTPAVEINDGQDFVPAKKGMLLGQHFSAIAAAGPINGPILAATMFGWLPALLWVVIGSIFVGGVHDMGSLIVSVRTKAKSITEVIRQQVSRRAWLLFMLLIWITLVYVIIAFTDITASAFVGDVELESGEVVAGAAIASSSIMYLILPMIMGLLIRFGGVKENTAILLFLPLVGLAIWGGKFLPVELPFADAMMDQKVWGLLIIVYCFIAASIPVWLLLQPRGALGGYFLYAALFVSAVGVIFGDFSIEYPALLNLDVEGQGMGSSFWFPMFPILFITIACGACSGFHSLVSSGTTSKQLRCQSDAKPVGYGAMLLEGMVAVIAIACVMVLPFDSAMTSKAPNFIYACGIGQFMELMGVPAVYGISFGLMAFTTFVYDTLDVCTRLGRYIIEEVTGWKSMKGKLFATLLTAGVPLFFLFQTFTNDQGITIPAWKIFWNTFGASNQLLAALALIGVTVWLFNTKSGRGKKYWLVPFIPAVLMFIMSNWALVIGVYEGWVLGKGHPAIPVVSFILIVLSILIAAETFVVLAKGSKKELVGSKLPLSE